ncbi:MAG: PhzF family phenazine biosynthesis protein, partial [Bacteroidales bacterium]|nr:PhzF family phenazine biosynthesis protein [Bacteroidales bacterium]
TYRYCHLDVFTDRPFTGNQLAVFPDATGLDSSTMQKIAMEMAFSETTFVLPPETEGTDARVRIFTPNTELPMAGHPTIGTAFALAHKGRIAPGSQNLVLGLEVGPTSVRLEWEANRLCFAWMTQPIPTFGTMPSNGPALATVLGLRKEDFSDTAPPVQVVSSGVPFLFVPLVSRRAVDSVVVDRSGLRDFCRAADLPELPMFVFSTETADDGATVYSRMFAPVFGIAEDPATGGASGPLGAYLVHHGVLAPEQARRMVSLQGVKMGRPSRIHVSIGTQNECIVDVNVGGQAVIIGEGEIYL